MRETEVEPLRTYREYPVEEMRARAASFHEALRRRRTVRRFSSRPIPREVIEDCLRAAGTAPSGANQQPWHFVVVGDPAVKRRIREAAEKVESEFYDKAAPEAWLAALSPLGTTPEKPFLEEAPWLIAIFARRYTVTPAATGEEKKVRHYYVSESVGIATGMLITALHNAGLVSLTYTPRPIGFLREILGRPAGDHPFMILVVGYPADDATVPILERKPLDRFTTFV